MSGMLRHGWADPRRNPLRGSILGSALHKAIEKITDEADTQKIFGRELGQAMAERDARVLPRDRRRPASSAA